MFSSAEASVSQQAAADAYYDWPTESRRHDWHLTSQASRLWLDVLLWWYLTTQIKRHKLEGWFYHTPFFLIYYCQVKDSLNKYDKKCHVNQPIKSQQSKTNIDQRTMSWYVYTLITRVSNRLVLMTLSTLKRSHWALKSSVAVWCRVDKIRSDKTVLYYCSPSCA